jgi:hypothetical protein
MGRQTRRIAWQSLTRAPPWIEGGHALPGLFDHRAITHRLDRAHAADMAKCGEGGAPALRGFIAVRVHIVSVCGGANMPLTGPIPEGRTFFGPHCGALYSVTQSRFRTGDSNH